MLDIGSGVGGPARFLARTTGCHVTALELQRELHSIAVDLTGRCGLSKRITHICGNALTCPRRSLRSVRAAAWEAHG